MQSVRTQGLSSVVVVMIGAAVMASGALLSVAEKQGVDIKMMSVATSTTEATSSYIAVDKEGDVHRVQDNAQMEAIIQNTDKSTETKEIDHTVLYSDSGFTPAELTVSVGEVVQFKNESTGVMKITTEAATASDCEASDKASVFQQCDSVDIYTHTFQSSGSYTYFNDGATSTSGVINVK